MSYFTEQYIHSKNKIEVEMDLSKSAKKSDLKNKAGVDTSDYAKKVDWASLKSDVDKLDIDKLENATSVLTHLESKIDKLGIGKFETTPVDVSKLSDVVTSKKMMLLKRLNIINWLKESATLRLLIPKN